MSAKPFSTLLPPITDVITSKTALESVPSLTLTGMINCPEKLVAGVIVYPPGACSAE